MRLPGLLLAVSAAAASAQDAPVELVAFRPETRTIGVGAVAQSELTVRSTGMGPMRLWIGFSVRDSAGRWYDVAADSLVLARGDTATRRLAWRVPAIAMRGPYRVVMAAWSGPPGGAGSTRLVSVDLENAFRVRGDPGLLMEQPSLPWRVASHPLGRGTMQPSRVWTDGKTFRLVLGTTGCDGAEMRSADRVGFGTYSARMRLPDAPGSLSAFFLYGDGATDNDEIDIEVFNDGSRRALLTAWIAGRQSRQAEIRLPFDPRAGFHDYTLQWSARQLVFLIDGRSVARWSSNYPVRPMRLISNVWWPMWLDCQLPASDRELVIQSIRRAPEPAVRPPR